MARRSTIKQPKSLPWKESLLLKVALIVAAGFWIYWPALHGDWLSDDGFYVTENPLMQDPARLWKAWFSPGSFIEYYPIEQTVQWVQWQLWGTDTFGYHLTNLVLHLTSALLVWRLLGKLGVRLAWLGALIFTVHPMAVESVAWISELKNTLSLPPFLLAMCAWIDYTQRDRNRDYWLALGLFLIAMLCKITMVSFPIIILIHAWWKHGTIRRKDWIASAPFFAVSLLLGLATIWAGQKYAANFSPDPPLIPIGDVFSRMALIGTTLSFYFFRCFWPVTPLIAYPLWKVDPPVLAQFLPWVISAALFLWLVTSRQKGARPVLLGLGFFILNLMPFLGFQYVSFMRFTWVMDHFLYIPIIGIIALLMAGLGWLEDRLPKRLHFYGNAFIALIVLLLAFQSHTYAKVWTDEYTLGAYTLQHNPGAWEAHNDMADALLLQGKFPEAIEQSKLAAAIDPDPVESHHNLGLAFLRAGRYEEAVDQLRQTIQLFPQNPETFCSLGTALTQMGKPSDAIDPFQRAIRLRPDHAPAYEGLGGALLQTGHLAEGIAQIQHALQLDPRSVPAHNDLGNGLMLSGHVSEAMEEYEKALKIDPDSAVLHHALAIALYKSGRIPEAIDHLKTALRLDPHYSNAQQTLDRVQAVPATTLPRDNPRKP